MFQRALILLTGFTTSVGAFVSSNNNNAFLKRSQAVVNMGMPGTDYLNSLSAPVVAEAWKISGGGKGNKGGKSKKKGEGSQHTAYVVNLAYGTGNKDLRKAFGEHGKVESVYIPIDRNTGRPKGIGFVTMSTEAELNTVIETFGNSQLGGRKIFVSKAKPRGEVGEKKEAMTKMYVGNISFDTTGDELIEYFSTWGSVKDCYVPLDRETGLPRGFAFITMAPDGVDAAIDNADGVEFGGRTIEVKVSLPRGTKAPKRQRSPETKLYVGNLSYDTDEDMLRETFEQYGTLLDLYMPIDRYSGDRRGFAFLTVEPEVAQQIIEELDGFELDGRILRVNEARPKNAPAEEYPEDNYEGDDSYDESYDEGYEEDASVAPVE